MISRYNNLSPNEGWESVCDFDMFDPSRSDYSYDGNINIAILPDWIGIVYEIPYMTKETGILFTQIYFNVIASYMAKYAENIEGTHYVKDDVIISKFEAKEQSLIIPTAKSVGKIRGFKYKYGNTFSAMLSLDIAYNNPTLLQKIEQEFFQSIKQLRNKASRI